MAKKRAKIDEPRPTCPECGCVVVATEAKPYGTAKSLRERVLEGIYCSADCILDAIKRGYPNNRVRRT